MDVAFDLYAFEFIYLFSKETHHNMSGVSKSDCESHQIICLDY